MIRQRLTLPAAPLALGSNYGLDLPPARRAPGLVRRSRVFCNDTFELTIHSHRPKRSAVVIQVPR